MIVDEIKHRRPPARLPPRIQRCAATLLPTGNEGTVRRDATLEGSSRHLPSDDKSIVAVEAVVDSRVDARFARLSPHGEVSAALVSELGIQDETHRPGD